jgi:hypothetical protein
MEREGLLPHSQQPANCPYREPARSSPYPHLNIILPSTPGLPIGLPNSDFPNKNLYTLLFSPIRATFSAHIILLDLIIRKILGYEYI